MRQRLVLSLVVAATVAVVACHPSNTSDLARPSDPVILKGSQLPRIPGVAPDEVVGFVRHDGAWHQIPVQVDEMHTANLAVVHNRPSEPGVDFLVYSDPGTLTGADPNRAIDLNDEIVFMARDAGDEATDGTADPDGVVAGSGAEVTVTDPAAGGAQGVVYLFRRDPGGGLHPSAGHNYVTYAFDLLNDRNGDGDSEYPEDYNFEPNGNVIGDPPSNPAPNKNPENTWATTSAYTTHFDDRWRNDELRITIAGASGVDILDRDKVFPFAGPDQPGPQPPPACVRTENTGAAGHGAFVSNIDGPVRAIRDYIGFNSGAYTQRRHVFYQARQDVTTFLRVHSLPDGPDAPHDYTDAALGMRYRNDLNRGGVVIDGVPDSVTLGTLGWEQVTGDQGTFTIVHRIDITEPGVTPTSFYADDSTPLPEFVQCTGDAKALATSGPSLQGGIANTDPRNDPHFDLTAHRTQYYDAPNQSLSDAQLRDAWVSTPLTTSATTWTG
jgi:hypothetical protein